MTKNRKQQRREWALSHDRLTRLTKQEVARDYIRLIASHQHTGYGLATTPSQMLGGGRPKNASQKLREKRYRRAANRRRRNEQTRRDDASSTGDPLET